MTHRAVDRALGLAERSTSSYFRTRRALLEATAVRIAGFAAELAPTPSDLESGARSLATTIDYWAGRHFEPAKLARLELLL